MPVGHIKNVILNSGQGSTFRQIDKLKNRNLLLGFTEYKDWVPHATYCSPVDINNRYITVGAFHSLLAFTRIFFLRTVAVASLNASTCPSLIYGG